MAVSARYLIDKSALARRSRPSVEQRLEPLMEGGLLATCGLVELEILFSARGGEEHRRVATDRRTIYELVPIEQPTFDRALAVQEALAYRGTHRAVPVTDLVIAAAAERAGLCVLHYDQDFERIAAVTGQPTEWVVPAGSVP